MSAKNKKENYDQRIIDTNICDIAKSNFLLYSLSTMVRAVPLSADGLIPIYRRLLFTMLEYNTKVKSARIVGDCLGKYSPHGDSATYQALQKITQDFKRNAPLTDGQGNWGSLDGDDAGGMRYTEVVMNKFARETYFGPEYKYCDYKANYDDTLQEPVALSPKIPLTLVNGVFGIVVGFQTNIPPHNLSEVCDATIAYLKGNDPYKCISGPDFPTGSRVYNVNNNIDRGLREGKSSVLIIPHTKIEPYGRGRYSIVIEDVPYIIDKTKFIENIVEDQKTNKLLENLSDIEDQSDKKVRILLVFKKTVGSAEIENIRKELINQKIISYSYNYSLLLISYDSKSKKISTPMRFSLTEIIDDWYQYRRIVLERYFTDMIDRCNRRDIILREVLIFVDNYKTLAPMIISDITNEELYFGFQKKGISKNTVDYILDSKYNRFRNKAEDIKKEIKDNLEELEIFKNNNSDIRTFIINEVREIKKKYGRERRTAIVTDKTI